MKNMDNLNKTRAFLTEFLSVILFFSVAAVIAINLYVEANRKNDESIVLSHASMRVQTVAEGIRAGNIVYKKGQEYIEYLDKNMQISAPEKAVYIQKVVVSSVGNEETSGMEYKYKISIFSRNDDKLIYSIELRKYVGMEVER